MKTKIILSIAACLAAFNSFSQIKIFPGGSVTIGSTAAASLNAVSHQVSGTKVAFVANTSAAATSAPLIVGQNAVSSSPGFAFLGDYQTGIAHPASSILAITIANSEKFRFNSSGQILNKTASQVAGTPEYSWDIDPNTGMFWEGADQLCFNTGGVERFGVNASGQFISFNAPHTASTPEFSWIGDLNTGIFHPTDEIIGFSTNGTERFRINSNGQLLSYNGPGSASTPDFSWGNDVNTGIFNPSADVLAFSTNGNERARFNSSGRFLLNTTSDNGIITTNSSDYRAASFSVTLSSDWAAGGVSFYANRANCGTYDVQLSGSGTVYYVAGAGWIYSQGNYLGSDRNIKDDIKGIDSALSRINRINGVLYKLKKEKQNPDVYGTAQEYMGVIAQDVEAVAPQVVKTLPDGTKSVCYEMLVGLLVEAIKEQNTKVAQLENDITNCCTNSGSQQNRKINTGNLNGGTSEYSGSSFIMQNVPNPFSKETLIDYFIAERSASSSILVFDMNGKLLKTFKLEGNGKGTLTINGNDFQPGMYYYSLIINNKEIGTHKMILTE